MLRSKKYLKPSKYGTFIMIFFRPLKNFVLSSQESIYNCVKRPRDNTSNHKLNLIGLSANLTCCV